MTLGAYMIVMGSGWICVYRGYWIMGTLLILSACGVIS